MRGMLGRSAAVLGAMGPASEDEFTHTGQEYVQDRDGGYRMDTKQGYFCLVSGLPL